MMQRIFKKNVSKQIRTWVHNTFPDKKLEYINNQMSIKNKEDYDYVAKMGSLEAISKLNTQIAYRAKVRAFRQLAQNYYNETMIQESGDSNDKVIDLLTRQNQLMDEIRTYKEENEALVYECENKDRNLKEANETVTILSLRINYMITQKFINMIEKVF